MLKVIILSAVASVSLVSLLAIAWYCYAKGLERKVKRQANVKRLYSKFTINAAGEVVPIQKMKA